MGLIGFRAHELALLVLLQGELELGDGSAGGSPKRQKFVTIRDAKRQAKGNIDVRGCRLRPTIKGCERPVKTVKTLEAVVTASLGWISAHDPEKFEGLRRCFTCSVEGHVKPDCL